MPYLRDPETLARQWAIPGTPGLEHRIGGLEKEDVPAMSPTTPTTTTTWFACGPRRWPGSPPTSPSSRSTIRTAPRCSCSAGAGRTGRSSRRRGGCARRGKNVAHAHLTHLNPFPRNLGDVLGSYDKVLVPEMNLGQLLKLVRAEFLVDAVGYNKVRGLPFRSDELAEAIEAML